MWSRALLNVAYLCHPRRSRNRTSNRVGDAPQQQPSTAEIRRLRFLDIPVELLVPILGYLDHRDLLRCCLICKYFKKVIGDHLQLQYIIELGADGLVDGDPDAKFTIAERLAMVLELRKSWREVDINSRISVPSSGSRPYKTFELSHGIFAKTVPSGLHLDAVSLPSQTNPQMRTVIKEDLDMIVEDLTFDPAQDLLVLVEAKPLGNASGFAKVHIRTFSANTPHPLAPQTIFHIPRTRDQDFNLLFKIRIVDDVISLFFREDEPHLYIWNWKTGTALVRFPEEHEMPPNTVDFCFTSNRSFILVGANGYGALHLYSFSPEHPNSPPALHTTLHLPRLSTNISIVHIQCQTGPFLTHCPKGTPFITSQESRVYNVWVEYAHTQANRLIRPRHAIFFHHSLIANCMSETQPELDWVDWGPQSTRFIECDSTLQSTRFIYGQRVICPPLSSNRGNSDGSMLHVFDFNVHSSRDTGHQDIPGNEVVFEESTVLSKSIFEEAVVTRLPYHLVSRTDTVIYSGYMIDEERIMGVKWQPDNGDIILFDVLRF